MLTHFYSVDARSIITGRVLIEGEIISVCDVQCLKYRIILLLIIIISLSQIIFLFSYISNTSHSLLYVVLITHHKRIGYVIIPKQKMSIPEGINSPSRRVDSICHRCDLSCRRSDFHYSDRSLAIDRDRSYHPFANSDEHSTRFPR